MSKHGCHNRAPLPKLVDMPAVYNISIEGHAVVCDGIEVIPFVFKRDCQYTLTELGRTDKGCIGCEWRKDD
jgi:hypothetical protein